MFKVGDSVVCVDDRFPQRNTTKHFKSLPVKDSVYTVRAQRPLNADGGVLLEELKNDPIMFSHLGGRLEPAFSPKRFVKLDNEHMVSVLAEANEILEEEPIMSHG